MKRRVLIVSTAYLPLVGGAELAVKEITDRLPDYEFDLICGRLDPKLKTCERIGRVNVRRYGVGGTIDKYVLPLFVLLRILARSYDIIWTVMASYGSFAVAFLKFLRPGAKHLLTLQEGDSEEHILNRVSIYYFFWRLIFKKADYIQAISKYLADLARRHGARCPIEVIPNGVDVKKFKVQSSKFKVHQATIITTSRLVPKNGIDILIRAVAQLQTMNYELRTLIAGSGPDERKLKMLTKELDVEDIVEFAGHVEPDKIPEYLAQADIFVRPSRSEGLGSSFIEAMAAGLPIIGTPVGGIPDFLRDPSTSSGQAATGLFVKVDDPEDLAEKIKLLLENRTLREKLSEQGKELALRDYSWDSIAERMDSIFGKLTRL